ncbi:glycosyltransferase family 25 protein [Limnohabitans sp.]|uniref:glycosyltransferase family 25 protein n=1 Tax=Limnohabitans sp. TaxID=1907725 RepID=UPI0035B0E045
MVALAQTTTIYVINLERSPQRLNEIAQRLATQGLSFERITAIDGKLATPEQQAQLDEQGYQRKHGKTSLPGELGCYLSHVEAIRAFLASGQQHAVILEDDAILEDGFSMVLHYLSQHSDQWDMVKLSGVHSGSPAAVATIDSRYRLSVMFSKCTCSSAYMLNRKAAQAYCLGLLPMSLPYDHEFDRGWAYGIKVRAITPFVVAHNEQTPTTIVAITPATRKLPGLQRLPAYGYRIKTEMCRLIYAVRQYLTAMRPHV